MIATDVFMTLNRSFMEGLDGGEYDPEADEINRAIQAFAGMCYPNGGGERGLPDLPPFAATKKVRSAPVVTKEVPIPPKPRIKPEWLSVTERVDPVEEQHLHAGRDFAVWWPAKPYHTKKMRVSRTEWRSVPGIDGSTLVIWTDEWANYFNPAICWRWDNFTDHFYVS